MSKLVLTFLLLASLTANALLADGHKEKKSILVVISHTESEDWTGKFFDDFKTEMDRKKSPVSVTLAELGVCRTRLCMPIPGAVERIGEYVKVHKPDIVVISEKPAIDALYSKSIEDLAETPVILCNFPAVLEFNNKIYPNATAVKVKLDFKSNVELAAKIFPKMRNVVVITDATVQGQNISKLAEEGLKTVKNLNFIYINGVNYSTHEMLSAISALPPEKTVILFTSWKSSKPEFFISSENMVKKLEDNFHIPIFTLRGIGLNNSMGGIMPDIKTSGKKLACIIEQIFNGTSAEKIVPAEPVMVTLLNWQKLAECGIDKSSLPPNAVYYNYPKPIIDLNSISVRIIGALIVLMLIGAALFELRYRHASGKSIRQLRALKERELEARETLQAVFDVSPFAISVKDANNEFRIVMCNTAFAETLKRPISAIISKNSIELGFKALDPAETMAEDAAVIKSGKKLSRIREVNTEDGETIIFEITKMPLFLDEGKKLLVGVLNNITALSETNRRLKKATEEAQSANKAKSYFLASMSHEIRTPLNAIIGFSELLNDRQTSDAERTEYVDSINFSANALLELLNDVLDLSKLEADQMVFAPVETDFAGLCREVAKVFDTKAAVKGVKISVNIREMPVMFIDRQRVRQILFNLLGNAVKFTDEGSIGIEAKFKEEKDGEGTLTFAVSDTGIGISREDQKELFNPFVQSSSIRGTSTANSGTGLGLAICKSMLSKMGGSISIKSEPGMGSLFTVRINSIKFKRGSTAHDMRTAEPFKALPDTLANLQTLVVDDIPMNLKVLEAVCKKLNLKTWLAETGEHAVEIFKSQKIDLVLSDLWMPDMNGAELASELRKIDKNVKIVAITADIENRENFDMQIFDRILIKPVSIKKLADIIREL